MRSNCWACSEPPMSFKAGSEKGGKKHTNSLVTRKSRPKRLTYFIGQRPSDIIKITFGFLRCKRFGGYMIHIHIDKTRTHGFSCIFWKQAYLLKFLCAETMDGLLSNSTTKNSSWCLCARPKTQVDVCEFVVNNSTQILRSSFVACKGGSGLG